MDHLLIVPVRQGISETFLASLRQAGWRITVTSDIVKAKQLLQNGDVNGLMIEFNPAIHDPDRFKILRYVHEFCPRVLVMMLQSGESLNVPGARLIQTLNTVEDVRSEATSHTPVELYHLSPAQKRIAELVAQAYPNREIARRLKIKEQSVRNELSRIFKKMGVWNRVELALLMREGVKSSEDQAGPQGEMPTAVWPAEMKPLADAHGAGPGNRVTM